MPEPNEFMKRAAAAEDYASYPPDIPTDRPTQARIYGLTLGSKDNFEVDRQFAAAGLKLFPEAVDIARQSRLFLYRSVRYLAQEAGITQFLDLGSGLPVENNVHEVAQKFQPEARVVYVDHDPIVLAHGRALLADNKSTTVIQADITDPEQMLNAPEAQALIDFTQPVAVLLYSIPHCIPDDDAARRAVRGCLDSTAPGSYLAFSHVVSDDAATAAEATKTVNRMGMPWKNRTPDVVNTWLDGLEPVDPGLLDVKDWRPDPDQPRLSDPHPVAQPYVGATMDQQRFYEYGGVLRKP